MNNINFFADRLKNIGDEALKEALYLNLNVDDVLLSYEIAGIPSPIMIKKNNMNIGYHTNVMDNGWGNGYVKIIPSHKHHGKGYDDIDVRVHGGLTFSEVIPNGDEWPEGHWVGFDTSHTGDNKYRWTKESVLDETKDLFSQLYNIKR